MSLDPKNRDQKGSCDICRKRLWPWRRLQITFVLSRDNPTVTVHGNYCSQDCAREAAFAIQLGLSL